MNPLDDTRIHPESYELDKKMVGDVHFEDVGQDKTIGQNNKITIRDEKIVGKLYPTDKKKIEDAADVEIKILIKDRVFLI